MQCASYESQLAAKQARVERAVRGLVPEVRQIVPSPAVLGYRNKAKLVAAAREGGEVFLGSYAPRSHDVVDMAGCQVTEAPLGPVAATVARLATRHRVPVYDERAHTGQLRYAILRANHAGQVLVILVSAQADVPALAALARDLGAAHPEVSGVVQNLNESRGGVLLGGTDHVLHGQGELADRVGEVTLALSARAFFQVNRAQAGAIYARVAEVAELSGSQVVADVYSGVGGIALTVAGRARRVIAIEESPVAAEDARHVVAAAEAGNVEVVTADAARGLSALDAADVVILDPPRKGAGPDVLGALARLRPPRVVYVSCGPESLGRDLGVLQELGYQASTCEPFDMLPHTPHVESITMLEPRRG
jgi:23S rRNA (uracil1939-C5)-methyltransferase